MGYEDLRRYQAILDNLRLVLEDHREHWQVFVYDQQRCEILYHAVRPDRHVAEIAAVDYALWHLFGIGRDTAAVDGTIDEPVLHFVQSK